MKPINKHIAFRFLDGSVRKKNTLYFQETTEWGFVVDNFQESVDKPRWGLVIEVADDVEDAGIVPGALILIEALKWTKQFDLSDVGVGTIWFTNEDNVIGVRTE